MTSATMGYLTVLAGMSENTKRLIFAIVFIVILIPVLLGYIGMWITKVMRWQGKKMDTLVHDVVVTKVITDKDHLKKYGSKKNLVYFFKQSWIPFIIMLAAVLILIITDACVEEGFSYNPFNWQDGIGSLFWHWDWHSEDIWVTVWGMRIIGSWPPLIASPHLVGKAVGSYLFLISGSVGIVYWLVAVQCYISRWWRLRHLCNSLFSKSLEGYQQGDDLTVTGVNGLGAAITAQTLQQQGQDTNTTNETTTVSVIDGKERPPLGGQDNNNNNGS